jgi:hypothetical protein
MLCLRAPWPRDDCFQLQAIPNGRVHRRRRSGSRLPTPASAPPRRRSSERRSVSVSAGTRGIAEAGPSGIDVVSPLVANLKTHGAVRTPASWPMRPSDHSVKQASRIGRRDFSCRPHARAGYAQRCAGVAGRSERPVRVRFATRAPCGPRGARSGGLGGALSV